MKKLFMAVSMLFFMVPSVYAATIGYKFTIDGSDSTNVPTLTFENLSDDATISSLSITIGNTAYDWDGVRDITGDDISYTLITPDYNLNGGLRSSVIQFTFSGFDAGESFSFEADVDQYANVVRNFEYVLFNNGSSDNALITVTFSDGTVLSDYLEDYTLTNDHIYTLSQTTAAVPVPSAIILLGIGLLGGAAMGRNKR